VKALQRFLVNSFSAQALAVKRVSRIISIRYCATALPAASGKAPGVVPRSLERVSR